MKRHSGTTWPALAIALLLPTGSFAGQQQQPHDQGRSQSEAQTGHEQSDPKDTRQGRGSDDGAVGTSGAVASVDVESIVDNPGAYLGSKVTIAGEVDDVISHSLFNIQEQGIVDIDDELLVLMRRDANQANPTITEDSKVQVTGTVRNFVRADLERDYGFTDWGLLGVDNDQFFIDYESRPVIIADSVKLLEVEER